MAAEGCRRVLPIPCCSGKHGSAVCLWSTFASTLATDSQPPQPDGNAALGSIKTDLQPLDSLTSRSASLSLCTLRRHSSKVGAVCVNALVRFCAGGDQRWSSLPRQVNNHTCLETRSQ